MGIFQRISNAANRRKGKGIRQEISASRIKLNPLCSNFENVFSQVMPLIDEMSVVQPYGVSQDGKPLSMNRTPELARLYNPNLTMGYHEFIQTMLAVWLTEPELDIHVSFDGGQVSAYTIVPAGSRKVLNGEEYFEFMTASSEIVKLYPDEVMTLRYSRNPVSLDDGISPALAIQIWAQIDDLVAQYQRAFFENGAVPATITFITASTKDKYDEKRKALESGLKGAKNRNKTVYAWRQMLDDGSTGDEIEVKTIQGNNSSLAIQDLNKIIIDRINKSYGVSNFIMGDDSSAKYDNAELSDHQFTKRRVYPALVKFWGQFQHELERVISEHRTRPLGYGITFDLEIPELTDRERTKEETKKLAAEKKRVDIDSLITLIKSGAQPATSVKALGLEQSWLPVADDVFRAHEKELEIAQMVNYTAKAPKALESGLKCEKTAFDAAGYVKEKILDAYTPKFKKSEKRIEEIYNLLMLVAEHYVKEVPGYDLDEIKRQIVAYLRAEANRGGLNGASGLLDNSFDMPSARNALNAILESGDANLSEEFYNNLDERIDDIVTRYDKDTGELIEATIREAAENNLSVGEIEDLLEERMPAVRAEVIARNETHYAINSGRLSLDTQIANDYGLEIKQQWVAHAGACDVCAAMNGEIVGIGKAFPDHKMLTQEMANELNERFPDRKIPYEAGDQVAYSQTQYNNYGKTPDAHVNCRCTFNEIVSVR